VGLAVSGPVVGEHLGARARRIRDGLDAAQCVIGDGGGFGDAVLVEDDRPREGVNNWQFERSSEPRLAESACGSGNSRPFWSSIITRLAGSSRR